MRRLIFACGLLAIAAVPLIRSAHAAEQWNYYTVQSAPLYSTSKAAAALAEEIGKVTNGEVTVRRHLAGTLQISTTNMASAVADNVVQMGEDQFFSGVVPVAAVLRLPLLIQNYDEFLKANAIVQPYVDAAYAKKGITVLAMYVSPLVSLWSSKREMKSLADVRGMKIRTSTPEQAEFVRKLGGSSVSIGPSEVPSALDRGVVDGIITGSVGVDLWKDLLKYGLLTQLNYTQFYIIANSESFNKLSAETKEKIRKVAAASGESVTDIQRNDDTAIMSSLGKFKIAAVTVTPAERAQMTATMTPYWEEWAKSRGPEVVELLGKVRAALGR